MPINKTYIIRDTLPCWVTYLYRVEAATEEEAREIFANSQTGYCGHEIGEAIDWVDYADIQVEEAEEMPIPQAEIPQSEWLVALEAILPYAESEAEALAELHRREGGLELEPHVNACHAALANARSLIAKVKGE